MFTIAGILLVTLIFVLNVTVANGDIYKFILFVNAVSVNSSEELSMQYVVVSLSNLDIGIEVHFYDGMTTYVATWLQFAFPIYPLCIVGGLSIASCHSVKMETMARKKIIPVITTVILLSYNKIMTTTFRGLFSYTII